MVLEQTKIKIKATNLERYGVENVSQNFDIQTRKITNSKKLRRKFIFPSGEEVWVQGYEAQAIGHLLSEGVEETDLRIRHDMPVIWYHFEGRKRRYYPDIFIPSMNTIIEVKSDYTFEIEKEKNLAKRDECICLGYYFEFMIYTRHGTLI